LPRASTTACEVKQQAGLLTMGDFYDEQSLIDRGDVAHDVPRDSSGSYPGLAFRLPVDTRVAVFPTSAKPFVKSEQEGEPPGVLEMLGWTILFGMMSFGGGAVLLCGQQASIGLKTASLVFAMLFVLSILTSAVRRLAHE
jgi:hypothetical protein